MSNRRDEHAYKCRQWELIEQWMDIGRMYIRANFICHKTDTWDSFSIEWRFVSVGCGVQFVHIVISKRDIYKVIHVVKLALFYVVQLQVRCMERVVLFSLRDLVGRRRKREEVAYFTLASVHYCGQRWERQNTILERMIMTQARAWV